MTVFEKFSGFEVEIKKVKDGKIYFQDNTVCSHSPQNVKLIMNNIKPTGLKKTTK